MAKTTALEENLILKHAAIKTTQFSATLVSNGFGWDLYM